MYESKVEIRVHRNIYGWMKIYGNSMDRTTEFIPNNITNNEIIWKYLNNNDWLSSNSDHLPDNEIWY